jgi:hypothetical protein
MICRRSTPLNTMRGVTHFSLYESNTESRPIGTAETGATAESADGGALRSATVLFVAETGRLIELHTDLTPALELVLEQLPQADAEVQLAEKLQVPRYIGREYLRAIARELGSQVPSQTALKWRGEPIVGSSLQLRVHHLAAIPAEHCLVVAERAMRVGSCSLAAAFFELASTVISEHSAAEWRRILTALQELFATDASHGAVVTTAEVSTLRERVTRVPSRV